MTDTKRDIKPMLGPTNPTTGNIKVLFKSEIDGFGMDHAQMSQMEAMGLPTNFEFGSMNSGSSSRLRTKQQKKTFWCEVCKIELNSEDTMNSHLKGVKHMKKKLTFANQLNPGQPDIVPIDNPQATRKKIPIRLQQKILESPHYIVGLDFIKEYIACSNSEMEPHYECHLCETKGQSNCMFQHLVGQNHRQHYANHIYDNDPSKMCLSQAELLSMAQEFNENNPALYDRIQTKHSDDEYPWPPGLEPWLLENGGSGIIPDGARNNFGKTRPMDSQLMSNLKKETKPLIVNDVENVPGAPSRSRFTLPDIDKIKPPGSAEEAKMMFQLGKDLLAAGSEGVKLDPRTKNLLDITLATMELKLNKAAIKTASSTSSLSSSSINSDKKLCSPSTSSHHNQYPRKPSHDDRDRRSRSRSFSDRSFDDDYPRRESSHSSYQRDDYHRSSSSTSHHRSSREGSYNKRRYEEDYDDYAGGKRSQDYYRDGGSNSRRHDDKGRRYGYDR